MMNLDNFERNVRGLIDVLSHVILGITEEFHDKTVRRTGIHNEIRFRI
jgi:hypothetical protein